MKNSRLGNHIEDELRMVDRGLKPNQSIQHLKNSRESLEDN